MDAAAVVFSWYCTEKAPAPKHGTTPRLRGVLKGGYSKVGVVTAVGTYHALAVLCLGL